MTSPDTILFAIQAGLQLFGAVRKAYVDGTRGRPLVLPLPRSADVDHTSAATWFTGAGSHVRHNYPLVEDIMNANNPDESMKEELVEIYLLARSIHNPSESPNESTRGIMAEEELNALLTIRQWQRGRYGDSPTALQTIGGTLVNVAIDYFLQKPGALSDKSPEGRALKTFLYTVDTTDYATTAVTDIIPDLMIAVVDSVSQNPDLIGGGEKEQLLVKNVAESLSQSAKKLLEDASAMQRRDASAWVQLTARALIEGGANTILHHPKAFFATADGESALITQVGTTITELLLSEDDVSIAPLVSANGLNTVVRAALEAVAQNPRLLKIDNAGLKHILTQIAADLAEHESIVSADIFPELVRLTLEKTGENLELLWNVASGQPEKHLLVAATKTLLAEISKAPSDATHWKPNFTKDNILTITESVLDEVVENPQWLVKKAGETNSYLGIAVQATLESLSQIDGNRISTQTAEQVLLASIKAVALNVSFLEKLPTVAGAENTPKTALNSTLDALFTTIFEQDTSSQAQWKLARQSTLSAIIEMGLFKLSEAGITADKIQVLRATVAENIQSEKAFDIYQFTEDLEARLASITH